MSLGFLTSKRMSPAVLVVAVGLVYANTFGNSWHYDDLHSITENLSLRSLENPSRLFTERAQFSRDADKAMFRPLLLFTFALNYAWSGLETYSYHIVNVALQAGCAVLVWLLLRGLGHATGPSLFGGLVFALHPLGTEPVNYISSRSELLMGFWVLAAVVLHQRAVESEGGRQLLARAASAACFGLGLLTKSVAITTPALLLLLDVVRRRRCRPLRPVTYAPYALLGAMYLFVIRAHLDEAVVSEPVRGLADQLTTQAKALAYYAKLLVFPIGLNVYHQFFEAGLVSVILAASLLVPTLAWLALRDRSRTGLLSVGWVGVTLAPTAVVPLHVLVNDHRLYLPLVGAVMGLVAVLGAKPLQGRRRRLVAALALLGLAATTMQRNRVWEDEFTLWSDAAAKSPHPLVPTAHIHLGNYAKDHGSLDVAIAEYQRALEISPGHVAARTNLGLVYEAMGDVDRAIDNYRSLLADDPEVDEAWHNLGNSLRLKASTLREAREPSAAGFFAQAREAYGNVSEDSYHYQLALNNIGTVLEVEGRPDSAVWYYRQALAVSVHTEDARINLDRFLVELPVHAPMLLESGRGEVAEGLCEQLLIAKPDHRASLFFLAVSRFEQGRYPESLSPNQRLVEVHPDFEAGYLQLANLYETLGNAGAASDVYRRHVDRFPTGELTEEARKRWQRLRQRNGR